jgi:hypothetical protein
MVVSELYPINFCDISECGHRGCNCLPLNKNHYIYGLIDPRNGEVFYIGKATRKYNKKIERFGEHFRSAKTNRDLQNPKKFRRLRKIIEAGYKDILLGHILPDVRYLPTKKTSTMPEIYGESREINLATVLHTLFFWKRIFSRKKSGQLFRSQRRQFELSPRTK